MIKRILSKLRRTILPTTADKWRARKGDETLRLAYDLDENSLVFDFGGFKGEWAQLIREKFDCRVVVFEPVNEFADSISERFRKDEKVEVLALALGKENKEETIHLAGDSSSTNGKFGPSEVIQVRDAAEWLQERGAPMIDLAKINIEGGEYDLLERLIDAGYLRKIRYLQIQFHPIGSDYQERIRRIREHISLTHRQDWCYEMVWESWVRIT